MLFLIFSLAFMWTYEGDSLYRGDIEGTAVSGDSIFMGRELDGYGWKGEGFVSSVEIVDDFTFAAVSDLGYVLRLRGSGKIDTLLSRPDAYISLGEMDGNLVVGISPGGKLLFLRGGQIKDSLDLPAETIYEIYDNSGIILIGTGPEGKIFEIDEDKTITEYYRTKASSVTEICSYDDRMYFGTSSPGLIYETEGKENVRIYYDPGFEEVNGLGFSGDTLCISGVVGNGNLLQGAVKFLHDNREFEPYRGGQILCGEIFENSFYAGEGEDGQIGRFYREGFHLVQDVEESRVTLLAAEDGVLFVGTGFPAKIYVMKKERRGKGEYISSVFSGGMAVEWGNLFYEGEGNIDFSIRGGRSSEVDTTWIEWREVDEGLNITEPYIQWKAEMSGRDSYLKKVEISYREKNSPPVISRIEVLPPSIGFGGGNGNVQPRKPLNQSEKERLRKMGFFIPENSFELEKGFRCIYWEASDPNGDNLLYDLYLRREDGDFYEISSNFPGNTYFLNTSMYPDGEYQAKISAKDSPSKAYPLSTEKKVSFKIDHSPPELVSIDTRNLGDSILVTGNVRDEISRITGVFYNFREGNQAIWNNAGSGDGFFDEKTEIFTFSIPRDSRYLVIKIFDRSNNSLLERIEL